MTTMISEVEYTGIKRDTAGGPRGHQNVRNSGGCLQQVAQKERGHCTDSILNSCKKERP